MAQKLMATTQYGDLSGTVSIDGQMGQFLSQFGAAAGMSKDSFIISFSLRSRTLHAESVEIDLFSVDAEIAGGNYEALQATATQQGHLTVFRTPVVVPIAKLMDQIKNLNIAVSLKGFDGIPLKIQEDN